MKVLITGGCGFLGSNLAAKCLKQGDSVTVLDDLSRKGTETNLSWLKSQGDFQFFQEDTKNFDAVEAAVKKTTPDVLFHLAGQVAMTTSLENPRRDFETNVMGGFNILEAVRKHSPQSIVLYSSTNKVYGDLEVGGFEETETRYLSKKFPRGFPETVTLDFQSPYGCSKGAVDQYMLDYARLFNLKTVVFRHSTIFGGRQFATFDQGWVGWFVGLAVQAQKLAYCEPFTIAGTGKQVRDILFISDLMDCYFAAIKHIDKSKGQAYNIGGGFENSLSLLELFKVLESELKVKLEFTRTAWRASDQKVFIADTAKAQRDFDFQPKTSKEEGLRQMIDWVRTPR